MYLVTTIKKLMENKMVKEETAKKILEKISELHLYEIESVQYLDTQNLGIAVWYKTFLKKGREDPIFMEAIENPDRQVTIRTAWEMGQKRNLKEIVEMYYGGKEVNITPFPSHYPAANGPVGIVIQDETGLEFIGFDFDIKENKFKNDEYDLVKKLHRKYFDIKK